MKARDLIEALLWCRQCGSKLIRRKDEKKSAFGRRKYCDARCRRRGPWVEALAVLLCLFVGCSSLPSLPSVQTPPSAYSAVPVPLPAPTPRFPGAAPSPPRQWFIEWDWPTNTGPVTFEVYHSTNLAGLSFAGGTNIPSGFTLFTNTLCTRNPIAADQAQEFFIVRAVNDAGASDWNQ
jgi:hypothetical protein